MPSPLPLDFPGGRIASDHLLPRFPKIAPIMIISDRTVNRGKGVGLQTASMDRGYGTARGMDGGTQVNKYACAIDCESMSAKKKHSRRATIECDVLSTWPRLHS